MADRLPPDDVFALARKHAPERMRIVHEGFDKEDLLGNLAPTKTKPPFGCPQTAVVTLPVTPALAHKPAAGHVNMLSPW